MSDEEESTGSSKIGNVSDRVLDAFISKLEAEEEYAEVAGRLKDVVFNDKVSEKTLRTALFGEEES